MREKQTRRTLQIDEPATNVTLFQGFEWYSTGSHHKHWQQLRKALPELKRIGIDNIWIPPGCKAASGQSNGYDIYDLYDLGEFDQKGTRATKWGSKEELVDLVNAAGAEGMGIYWDTVLNHKAAADYTETCQAVKVDPSDRRKETEPPREVTVWTGFDFPGRANKHSDFKYHWNHFSGIDYEARSNSHGIWRFIGDQKPGWAKDVSQELGNYDYLMLADVDFSQPDVRADIFHFGEWLSKELGPGLRGMRFDAIKHYSQRFLQDLVNHLDRTVGKDWFFVAEYWDSDIKKLAPIIEAFKRRISLFDVQLVYNFSASSKAKHCDLRTMFGGTLAKYYPENAVTFVQNHDTQETQALEAVVEEWFLPLAYAFILLWNDSGYPCVFYGDLYGIQGPKPRRPACGGRLPRLILARKLFAYGPQHEYADEAECIGWTREGAGAKKRSNKWSGVAVVLNTAWSWNQKTMYVGRQHAGEQWVDIMGWAWGQVLIDRGGEGCFPVGHRPMSVWVNKAATGRRKVDELVFDDDIYETEKAKQQAFLRTLDNSPTIARKLGLC